MGGRSHTGKRTHIRAALKHLDQIGARHKKAEPLNSGHVRISWEKDGRDYSLTASCSPRDPSGTGLRLCAEIKRVMNGYYNRTG